MKSCSLVLLLLLSALYASAQTLKPVPEKVSKLHKAGAGFKEYTLWEAASSSENDETYTPVVSRYRLATLNAGQLEKLQAEKPQTLSFEIPYGQGQLRLELYRVQIAGEGFGVYTDKGRADYEEGLFYRGIISGDYTSLAAFAFFGDEIIGLASGQALGNINVGRLREPGNRSKYIIYSDRYLAASPGKTCNNPGAVPGPMSVNHQTPKMDDRSTHCVRFYYEVSDYAYQQLGQNLTHTANWAAAVHNNTAAVYANDGMTVALSEIFVWTTSMPFAGLEGFTAYRRAFNGDVAVGAGMGGLAWQGFLCSALNGSSGVSVGPYCVTEGDTALQTVPLFSQSVYVNAHETGHVIGSSHTHQCVWNGNNTQIDDCGNTLPGPFPPGQEPGWCYDSLNPILPANGTIMSYCGLWDFSQGFGPQPAQLLRDRIENASCLGSDCVVSCESSIDSINVVPYASAALLTIYDSNPLADTWEVRRLTGDPWTTITSPTYVMPLWPNNQFNIQVREVCDAGFSANFITEEFIQTPLGVCGQHAYDGGGPAYPYSAYGDDQVSVYTPDAPFSHVTLTFQVFDINPQHTLRIYDGPDTNGTYVAYTGSVLPPVIASTHPAGALTLRLINQSGFNTYGGWDMLVGCAANPTTASFSVSDSGICRGQQVTYTDHSSNNPVAWAWEFPGGNPQTSVQQNPVVTYDTAGVYAAVLTATNAGGSDTLTQAAYITVHELPAAPVVTVSGGTLQSGYAAGNQWYGPGGAVAGATGQTYTPPANGTYYVIHTDANGCVSVPSSPVVLTASLEAWAPMTADWKVYPNPIGNAFTVSWEEGTEAESIRLYDVAGRIVYAASVWGLPSVEVESAHLASGSYVLELLSRKGSVRKILIK